VAELAADAVIITSLDDPSAYYGKVVDVMDKERILVPDILNLKV
jgi:hypothetical protein